jgi:hypothetical protein
MTTTSTMKPQDISDATAVFPARVSHLMPAYGHVPDEFKRGGNPWVELTSRWFYSGLKGATFTPKDGIDKAKALRHLSAVIGSYEPKHEHKEAAVAYLLSLWFVRVELDGKQVAP